MEEEKSDPSGALDPARWVDDHGNAMFRYALLRLRDPSAAEESVQEALLAALRARESFSGLSSERTWLIGILKHKVVDWIRRRSREQPAAGADLAETADALEEQVFDAEGRWRAAGQSWRTDPEQAGERAEFRQQLTECVEELPPRMADAFGLRELEQLETAEICKVMGITESNLWVMMHRARLRLRGCLTAKQTLPATPR